PLARRVAMRAGGDVELASEPGKGTTAVLVLPATTRLAARSARSAPGKLSAVVTVRDHRTAALISQVLIGAGVRLKAVRGPRPGKADLWVTESSPGALGAAQRWRRGKAGRALVLLGSPARKARAEWAALGATIIEAPDDFQAIRHALGEA